MSRVVIKRKKKEESFRDDVVKQAFEFVRENKGLKISSTMGYTSPRLSSEFMDCSMPMTFDQYSMCSYGCLYCFAYYYKTKPGGNFVTDLHAINAQKLISAIEGKPTTAKMKIYYDNFFKKKFLLHWGGMADPFCNFEAANKVGLPLLKTLGRHNYPTLFSFKGSTILKDEYLKIFEKYSKQRNFAFQISIVTGDDDLAKLIEPGVPLPTERFKMMRILTRMGYWTILRLRPYIIGITDLSIDSILEKSLAAGFNAVSLEFFAVDSRTSAGMVDRYALIAKMIGVDDLKEYFKVLSPRRRGTYLRLNRLVKEEHVKKIYQFCQKHGILFACSDPDYKELNMSGSCCGMPDHYPVNRGLENWSKEQLTYHLKELRLKYHETGIAHELRFEDVFLNEDEDSWLNSQRAAQSETFWLAKMPNYCRKRYTSRMVARRIWNNLRSPTNPTHYLHGKLLPIGIDENENLIFRYNPVSYEKRWVDEGIDLCVE